mgnify:CR=1 FL=1
MRQKISFTSRILALILCICTLFSFAPANGGTEELFKDPEITESIEEAAEPEAGTVVSEAEAEGIVSGAADPEEAEEEIISETSEPEGRAEETSWKISRSAEEETGPEA